MYEDYPYTPEQIARIYDDIKERMRTRFEWRTQFAGHFVAWLLIAVVGGIASGLYVEMGFWAIAALLWTAGLAVHGANVALAEARERATDREMTRYGLRQADAAAFARRKNDEAAAERLRLVQISDDGELVDVDGV